MVKKKKTLFKRRIFAQPINLLTHLDILHWRRFQEVCINCECLKHALDIFFFSDKLFYIFVYLTLRNQNE